MKTGITGVILALMVMVGLLWEPMVANVSERLALSPQTDSLTVLADEEVEGLAEIMLRHHAVLDGLDRGDWSARLSVYEQTRTQLDNLLLESELASLNPPFLNLAMGGDIHR